MATTNTKTRARSTSANKQANKAVEEKAPVVSQEAATIEDKPLVIKDIDPEQYVTVKNGFQGKLIYKSSKTGERFIWNEFGDEQEIQLRELKNAKNSNKKFFMNNWFMFDEDWIIDYLGVGKYYCNAIKLSDFDNLFFKTPAEIKKTIELLSAGQKKSVAYRAAELIAEKRIDSMKTVAVLEEALGVELVER